MQVLAFKRRYFTWWWILRVWRQLDLLAGVAPTLQWHQDCSKTLLKWRTWKWWKSSFVIFPFLLSFFSQPIAPYVGMHGLLAIVNRVTIVCYPLVCVHCGPVVDFFITKQTSLHPFDFIRNLFHLLVKQWLTGTIPATSPYPRTYRHLVVCLKEAGMGALADHFIHEILLELGQEWAPDDEIVNSSSPFS